MSSPTNSDNSTGGDASFSAKLVDAQTLQPFREFLLGDDRSKVYVEIQAGREYFVLIQTRNAPRFKADVFVDGKSLGYRYRARDGRDCHKLLGLRSVRNGENHVLALKFKKRENMSDDELEQYPDKDNKDDMTVRVDFHCVDREWQPKKISHTTSGYNADINWSTDNDDRTGEVYSTVGTVETRGPAVSKRVFSTGSFLGSIQLHYRTPEELAEMLEEARREDTMLKRRSRLGRRYGCKA